MTSDDEDDQVGLTLQVAFNAQELAQARAGKAVDRVLPFKGSDSEYELTYQLQ